MQPPPYGQPGPGLAPPPPSNKRSDGEMVVLYGTSVFYGIGTGLWLDGVAGESDIGFASIAPIVFGAAVPVGLYGFDHYYPFHRGVPESISTGLLLGAVEGVAIAGTQWQLSGGGNPGNTSWGFGGQATATWLFATGGGVGGYVFGEWLRPDSRSLTFIASGGAWGAISGSLFGAGVGSSAPCPVQLPGQPPCTAAWADSASVVGLIGYNVGLAATGILSIKYMPSWRSQQWMWGGFLLGTAASSIVYLGYIGSADDPRHGLIANGLGGLAGVAIAGVLTAHMKDDNGTNNAVQHGAWTAPFQLAMRPVTSPVYGSTQTTGAQLTAWGDF
jgi:hypothetical protein